MRIYQLEGFYYVGREGGYTRAARAMPYPIGEPAVHAQVKSLQEDLGVRLVERVGRGKIILTPAGRILHEFVAPYFEGLSQLERRIRQDNVGILILSATKIVHLDLLPPAVRAFREAHPQIQVVLRDAGEPEVVGQVVQGEADIGVTFLPEPPVGLESIKIGELEAALLVPAGHPLAKQTRVTAEQVAAHPLVVFAKGSPARVLLDRYCSEKGITYEVAVETQDHELTRTYVAEGLGVGIVPRIRGQQPETRGLGVKVVSLGQDIPRYPIYLMHRKGALEWAPAASLAERLMVGAEA